MKKMDGKTMIKLEPECIMYDTGREEIDTTEGNGTALNPVSVPSKRLTEDQFNNTLHEPRHQKKMDGKVVFKIEPEFIIDDNIGTYETILNEGGSEESWSIKVQSVAKSDSEGPSCSKEETMAQDQSTERNTTAGYSESEKTTWVNYSGPKIEKMFEENRETTASVSCPVVDVETSTSTLVQQPTAAMKIDVEHWILTEDKALQEEFIGADTDQEGRPSCIKMEESHVKEEPFLEGKLNEEKEKIMRDASQHHNVSEEKSWKEEKQEPQNAARWEKNTGNTLFEATVIQESSTTWLKSEPSNATSIDLDEKKYFPCDECGKRFLYFSKLKQHQRIHTGEKPYTCDECGKSFTGFGHLKRHHIVHTGKKPYTCDECGKLFTQTFHLKTHQLIHSGVNPYTCDECGKSFSTADSVKRHQRIHAGVKNYTCNDCSKSFTQSGDLKKHQRIHAGVKNYTCDECGKSFTEAGNLKTHQRIHTGLKPYICDECGKSFTQAGDLKRHQRIHAGTNRYTCPVCGKSFARSSNLTLHQRTHSAALM